jgi:hypothetical protein
LQDTPQQQQHNKQQGSPLQACQDGLSGFLAQLSQAKLLVAGAMAAVVSRTAMAPLERVKMDLLLKTSTRSAMQTALYVYEREGIAGFWKGNGLNLLRTAPFKVRCWCWCLEGRFKKSGLTMCWYVCVRSAWKGCIMGFSSRGRGMKVTVMHCASRQQC